MLVLSIVTMFAVALFKMFWLLMGVLALDGGPMPKIYVINLVQAPAYLVSALTAWKWPWLAEFIAGLTLAAILTKIIPPPIFPYKGYLFEEYAFIAGANLAFFAAFLLRRSRIRAA
jgi:hypothetical protein